MKIILHADDFGFDNDTLKATIDCFEKGALTSATIMPTMSSTKDALAYAKENSQYSFGVHLTYVDRLRPVSNPDKIKSLLKNDVFLPSNKIRIKSFLNLLNKKEIVEETKRQIGLLLDSSVSVSHVDSHGHIHKFPIFQEAIEEAINYFNIKKVRKGQDTFLSTVDKAGLKRKLLNAINNKMDSGLKKKFLSTDYFYMPTNSFDVDWGKEILKIISSLDNEHTLEIGVHPGYNDKWRLREYKDIILFSNLIKESSNRLITWNDI
ncbi:ChbG/HpnK family deacetylase [Chryseobacterium foetidum]|uniref:ChbG/HpnK family deacetylase n=1 Tax=Chryseobacterium foetidum TaxID=2951057 RepID=UPI0021CA237A|nr:ChbG/HpnK family deacetylase [Chryseobacterium foetidum]